MAAATLFLSGLLYLLTGGSFLLVAQRVLRRTASAENQLARTAHAAWWAGLGAYLLIQGSFTAIAAQYTLDDGLYRSSRLFAIPLLCVAVWGISTYLLHLYTGNRKVAAWIGLFYGLVCVLFLYSTFRVPHEPLLVENWVIGYDDSSSLSRIIYVLVGAPPIIASLAYLGLLRRVHEPVQRYRIWLGGISILAYVGGGLAARLASSDALAFLTLIPLGILAAVAAVAAQFPPLRIRSQTVDRSATGTPTQDSIRAVRKHAMDQRLRELI